MRYIGIEADGAAVDFQKTLAAVLRADNIGLDAWIESHGGHSCTDLPVAGHLAYLDPAGLGTFGKRGDKRVAALSAETVPHSFCKTATLFFSSLLKHGTLQLMISLGTPNNNCSQHLFQ